MNSQAGYHFIFSVMASLVGNGSRFSSAHAFVGIVLLPLMVFAILMGNAQYHHFAFYKRYSGYVRILHFSVGTITFVLGNVNVILGWYTLSLENSSYAFGYIGYGAWMVILAYLFYKAEDKLFVKNKVSRDIMGLELSHQHISKLGNLPQFNQEEYSSRVQQGDLWILIDGVIFVRS
jgi:hypothetical protein